MPHPANHSISATQLTTPSQPLHMKSIQTFMVFVYSNPFTFPIPFAHRKTSIISEAITPLTIGPGNPPRSSTFRKAPSEGEKNLQKSFSAPPAPRHFASLRKAPTANLLGCDSTRRQLPVYILLSLGIQIKLLNGLINFLSQQRQAKKTFIKKKKTFCQAMPIWLVFYAPQRKTFLRSRKKLFLLRLRFVCVFRLVFFSSRLYNPQIKDPQ